jgi:hypothetical protein
MSSYQHPDGLETTPAEVLEEFKDPHLKSREVTGHHNAHTDARDMRQHFGIPPFDPDAFEWGLVDDVLVHEVDADAGRTAGGTDVFAVGAPGSGKSSLANYWAVRLSEINDEKVVWRASASRSEWLPLAPWATLWLPEGDVEARLRPTDPRESAVRVGVEDLEEIVRDIERYATPRDLNDSMDSGINIVYPDPAMAGCQTVVEQSARQVEPPDGREELFSPDDPTKHWWFAWVLDRVDSGPHDWTTWICDEIGDICPHGARKDSYATYQKVELLKDTWVDARKHHLSIFGFGHSEADVHGMVRRKMRWRVAMPKSSNPTSASGIVGFQTVPMRTDMTSDWGPGRALMFTESSFQQFRWKPMPTGTDWKLHVRVSPHISVSQ